MSPIRMEIDGRLPFHVYVLENANGRFYVGHTDDLVRRVAEHEDTSRPASKHSARNGPWKLDWSERHGTRSSAMVRERKIKSMKSARWIRENLLSSAERVPARRG